MSIPVVSLINKDLLDTLMIRKLFFIATVLSLMLTTVIAKQTPVVFEADDFVTLALDCAHKQYPNKISHVLNDDTDAQTPKQLYPAFYGCFDWHSAVHGHWQLARYLRLYPDGEHIGAAIAILERSITAQNIAVELAYFQEEGRSGFERPYGLAWLMQLHAELVEIKSPLAPILKPLVTHVRLQLMEWLPKLNYPIRIGEHFQTAFAFGLMLDWARVANDKAFEQLLVQRSRALYGNDRDCPLTYEPSGHDFLSPCLGEADLMRRVLSTAEYAQWLKAFLPRIGQNNWLPIAQISDRTDGKLAHLDGLNLSRAWMLAGIASGLPESDPRHAQLLASSQAHQQAGLDGITSGHYAGQHWLGSFAMYLQTGRGIR